MDEVRLLPATAIASGFRQAAEKEKEAAENFKTMGGYENYLKYLMKDGAADMLLGMADDIMKMEPVDVDVLRAVLIQKIESKSKDKPVLYWRDAGADQVCPVCGYVCDDDYYIENYCTKCGTRPIDPWAEKERMKE